MTENSTPAEIRAFNRVHLWYNRVHPSGLQAVNDRLCWLSDESDRSFGDLGGIGSVIDRFKVEHPDKQIHLMQHDQLDGVLDDTGMFWHPSVADRQREGNYPNFRITNADGSVWYWDGFFCP